MIETLISNNMNLKVRLSLMNFLEFAVWGAYLTCMGIYLKNIGMASDIGWFFAMQGIVSIFMPPLSVSSPTDGFPPNVCSASAI